MGVIAALGAVAAAALLLWAARWTGGKALDLLRTVRSALRGSAGAVGTYVSSNHSTHLYRFTTSDGRSVHAYVPRTSLQDTRRRAGSTARLRYRIDDPKTVSFAAVDLFAMPVGVAMTFLLTAMCVVFAVVLLFLGFMAATGR
ncbi:hypothetical protein GCM10010329_31200 [Streptomyces spiroverticillatus]|uniref:DUF3592 domain-containing protein n=1 Tax=Streptomyces finlayi TaxID=67296 RepID=A0A919C9E3_9ACTN|nr:hypothetical protein [Streptomyces finlayi]GHA06387.1 hypothetical protein GCM10010329_31200 [Streptomyces spiroverticillatus]GHC89984.1 hypothetical protein GCM10010334_23610 [Streptomyces finlayi]